MIHFKKLIIFSIFVPGMAGYRTSSAKLEGSFADTDVLSKINA